LYRGRRGAFAKRPKRRDTPGQSLLWLLWTCDGFLAHAWHSSLLATTGFAESGTDELIQRGRYLAEEVAMCQECHTPREASGALALNQWMKGGPVFFQPATMVSDWADRVPGIAGLPGWTDADFLYFLENGRRATGEIPKPR
jgi:hypothetical protein